MKKILIIGAGPGGLTAGMILAKKGYNVEIFEKSSQVGGRNAKIQMDDFIFDIGPTFLMMRSALDKSFELAGRRTEDYLTLKKLETLYRLDFHDKYIDIPNDKGLLKKRIKEIFNEDPKNIDHFFSEQKKAFDAFTELLSKPFMSPLDYLSRKTLRSLPYSKGLLYSVYDILSSYFKNDFLRLCFTFQSKYIGMSPKECPGFFNIIPYIEHELGIYHVIGGLNQISEGMAKIVREEKGKINLNTEVKKIIIKNKKVKGIELLNGEKIYSDTVIINSDFAYSMSNLIEEGILKKYSKKNLLRKNYSCSVFMLYLGLDKIYNLNHHSIFFAKDYWRNIDEITHQKMVSDDFSFYVQNASITDDTLANKGRSTLYVLVPMPNNKSKIEWKDKINFREKIIDALIKRAGMKDLKKHIVKEHIITPSNFEKDYNVFLGATFNLAHSFDQMLYFRPHNKFEEIEGCYLVGGGTHPGSGLPTIYQSGIITSNLISKRKR